MLLNFQAGNSVGAPEDVNLSRDNTRRPASQVKPGMRVLSLLPTRNTITAGIKTCQGRFS